MKQREIVQLMEQLKNAQHAVNPSADWVSKNRTALFSHINRTTEEIPTRTFTLAHVWYALSLIMPQRTVYAVVRPAVIFILCVSVGTTGWLTTVSASLASLPGDTMYPVKLATESTQAVLVQAIQGDAATAELHIAFASRRADEVHKIIESKQNQERVQQAVQNLKTEVQSASANLASAEQSAPGSSLAVAKSIDRKLQELAKSAEEADIHVSSSETVAAIQQLKQVTDQVKFASSVVSSTPNAAGIGIGIVLTTSTSAGAFVTSTNPITLITGISSTTPVVAAPRVVAAPTSVAPVIPIIIVAPVNHVKDFPIRPLELESNVVDGATPITLETWIEKTD